MCVCVSPRWRRIGEGKCGEEGGGVGGREEKSKGERKREREKGRRRVR